MFAWQNIMALSQLGHEVHMAIAEPTGPVDADLNEVCESVTYGVPIPPRPWQVFERAVDRVFRPETIPFRLPNWKGVRQQMLAAVERVQPDVIWADWIGTLLHLPSAPPVVYGHLDFLHQLQHVRRDLHGGRLRRPDIVSTPQLEQLEMELVRSSAYVVSVSATDVPLIEALGVPCVYMPIVGQSIPRPAGPLPSRARAFLLGRSNTAMNMSRRNLRQDIWPKLGSRASELEWHQVGAPPGGKTSDWEWVEAHFKLHGFVENLDTVLRPSDLCLVPYREHTGFRAKFVTASGYGMVNIGYESTFGVAQEFVPNENCLAAVDDEHFAELLLDYASDPEMRRRLSEGSRALYENEFSLEAQYPLYESALSVATGRTSA